MKGSRAGQVFYDAWQALIAGDFLVSGSGVSRISDVKRRDWISMIAPTSHDRIKMIAAEAKGFVYCVSSLGVTGVRSEITTDIGAMVRLVKEANPDISCAVGFGISTPAQAEKMAAVSDGAIVGSAIVRLCEKYGREAAGPIGEYVRSMKVAVLQKD